jgi:hypothetical protein
MALGTPELLLLSAAVTKDPSRGDALGGVLDAIDIAAREARRLAEGAVPDHIPHYSPGRGTDSTTFVSAQVMDRGGGHGMGSNINGHAAAAGAAAGAAAADDDAAFARAMPAATTGPNNSFFTVAEVANDDTDYDDGTGNNDGRANGADLDLAQEPQTQPQPQPQPQAQAQPQPRKRFVISPPPGPASPSSRSHSPVMVVRDRSRSPVQSRTRSPSPTKKSNPAANAVSAKANAAKRDQQQQQQQQHQQRRRARSPSPVRTLATEGALRVPAAHFDPWAACAARGAGRYGFLAAGSIHIVTKGPQADAVLEAMARADQSPAAVAETATRIIAALGPAGAGPLAAAGKPGAASSVGPSTQRTLGARAAAAAAWPVEAFSVSRATSTLTEPLHTGMRKRYNARHAERGETCCIAVAAFRGLDDETAQRQARAAEAATRKCLHTLFPALMDASLRPLRESAHSLDTIRGAIYVVYIAFRRAK